MSSRTIADICSLQVDYTCRQAGCQAFFGGWVAWGAWQVRRVVREDRVDCRRRDVRHAGAASMWTAAGLGMLHAPRQPEGSTRQAGDPLGVTRIPVQPGLVPVLTTTRSSWIFEEKSPATLSRAAPNEQAPAPAPGAGPGLIRELKGEYSIRLSDSMRSPEQATSPRSLATNMRALNANSPLTEARAPTWRHAVQFVREGARHPRVRCRIRPGPRRAAWRTWSARHCCAARAWRAGSGDVRRWS